MSKGKCVLLFGAILGFAFLDSYRVRSKPEPTPVPMPDRQALAPVTGATEGIKAKEQVKEDEPLTFERTHQGLITSKAPSSTEEPYTDSEVSPTDILFGPLIFLRRVGIFQVEMRKDSPEPRPIKMPRLSAIDRVEIIPMYSMVGNDDGISHKRTGRVLADKKRIQRLLAFVDARNNEWSYPWYDWNPPPRLRIRIVSEDATLSLQLGTTWIGSPAKVPKGNRSTKLIHISIHERDELCEILDVEGDWK